MYSLKSEALQSSITFLISNEAGYLLLSVLGYVINPCSYSFSAICIVVLGLIPKCSDANFNINTVFNAIGLL